MIDVEERYHDAPEEAGRHNALEEQTVQFITPRHQIFVDKAADQQPQRKYHANADEHRQWGEPDGEDGPERSRDCPTNGTGNGYCDVTLSSEIKPQFRKAEIRCHDLSAPNVLFNGISTLCPVEEC